ncbi:MAG: FAD-dependent oxidoreductase, partial [Halofilum sp. (in: g-proteobacteria)]
MDYDVVVIGSGAAARTVATACADEGWRVAVCDHRPLGGTCMLRGCDPKKALMSGTETVEAVRRMHGAGVAGELRIDWPALMRFKRIFTDGVPERQMRGYADRGIDVYRDTASFVDEQRLRAGATELSARYFVLAIGAEPLPLPVAGAEHLSDSSRFLEFERLPRRLALVGGGYIAAEFAHIAARAGADVTMIERNPRLLTG